MISFMRDLEHRLLKMRGERERERGGRKMRGLGGGVRGEDSGRLGKERMEKRRIFKKKAVVSKQKLLS